MIIYNQNKKCGESFLQSPIRITTASFFQKVLLTHIKLKIFAYNFTIYYL